MQVAQYQTFGANASKLAYLRPKDGVMKNTRVLRGLL